MEQNASRGRTVGGIETRSLALALQRDEAELELVPEAGGMLNRLVLCAGRQRVDVVAGLAPEEAVRSNPAYRGVPLFPFPNRLADGCYRFGGRHYQFPVNEAKLHNRLHGFLYQMEPEIVERLHENESSQVSLLYAYDGSLPAYPFRSDVRMTYRLAPDGLRVDMAVVNNSDQLMPVGLGWHPYYCLGSQKVDDLMLSLPDVRHMPVDQRMLPTGETAPYTAFSSLRRMGSTNFDDCYQLAEEAERASVHLWSESTGLGLEVWQDAAFGYLQLCTAPDRQSIAIEPMTCAANAFNSGQGLMTLAPGQEFSGAFGVHLTNRKP